jgi:hypothetical protein
MHNLWKLLPAAILAAGAVAAAPAVASASPQPTLPAGVTAGGPMQYAPSIHIPKTDLPNVQAETHADVAAGTLYSYNWAGYVDLPKSGKSFTFVGAAFTIPVQTANEKNNCVTAARDDSVGVSYAYYWAGLSGWSNTTANNTTVQQEGAATKCLPNGTVSNFAWYEMYPNNPVAFTGVSPGNKIVVTTTYANGKYDLYLHDVTNGGHFNVVESCVSGGYGCARTSAEVITEDPGYGPEGGEWLAPYGAVNYSGTGVKGSGVSGPLSKSSDWSGWRIDEEYKGSVMQTTRSLNAAGNAFTDDFNAPY